jgi:hypothetical protein
VTPTPGRYLLPLFDFPLYLLPSATPTPLPLFIPDLDLDLDLDFGF